MNDVTIQDQPTREKIEILQSLMSVMPQVDLSNHTKHHFADGMYCRELFRPAGTTIVGKVHKREHFYIVLFGAVTVVGDGFRETITAPRIIVSKPGTKRCPEYLVFQHFVLSCHPNHLRLNIEIILI